MDTTNLYESFSWADWIVYIIIVYAIFYFSRLLFQKAYGSFFGGNEE